MGKIQFEGDPDLRIKRVYYAGTDIIQPGYWLNYDVAATKGATDRKTQLGNQVVKPATANLAAPAGAVASGQANKQGPCFVDIVVPQKGEHVEVYCKANATAYATGLAPADGSYALAAHADSGLNLPLVGVAAETANTSVTEANKLVMFV